MNSNEMMKIIVRAMVEGGWKAKRQCTEGEQVSTDWYIINTTIYFRFRKDSIPSSKSYGINDLLADPDAMKSAYGDKSYWFETSDEYGDGVCYDTGVPVWQHHSLEALKLIHNKGADAAIEYLYENLPKKATE